MTRKTFLFTALLAPFLTAGDCAGKEQPAEDDTITPPPVAQAPEASEPPVAEPTAEVVAAVVKPETVVTPDGTQLAITPTGPSGEFGCALSESLKDTGKLGVILKVPSEVCQRGWEVYDTRAVQCGEAANYQDGIVIDKGNHVVTAAMVATVTSYDWTTPKAPKGQTWSTSMQVRRSSLWGRCKAKAKADQKVVARRHTLTDSVTMEVKEGSGTPVFATTN